ncbi:50S ribosomal protein L32e [Vulcanisaeta souniana]|uniref:Large ribosomal subunit protein eL32 n=1 Tax=Vulcanisaeta souniana JCM 11219 TaxID=1293586 RepID=A0A830EL02_9CREN|nr:50S ribosomal protein L32e [Vulcanisaeta souniana]BDR93069.1 hypothetical protein Vsou_21620 [Vulcanisaeta souniana JCM 11219]GGI87317.1 hypothetical protein GCM10007112_25290 [Vulcanisaeta souniana JCM 11219]
MSAEENKPTEQEQRQQQETESTNEQPAQQQTQTVQQEIAKTAETKPEVKEVKLPRPRASLSGRLRQLLRLRLLMERREPRWMRMDEWKYLKVAHGEHWRRPRGNDNKIRLEIKGYPKRVKVGYGKPRLVRNLHPSGFRLVIVHRPEDIDRVDPTRDAVVIGRTVGLRKRIEIVKRAIDKGVRVINVTKDVIEELKRTQ